MASGKKKATARTALKFKDLKSKKSPKGGSIQWGDKIFSTGGGSAGLKL